MVEMDPHAIVRKWKNAYGLTDWDIRFTHAPVEEGLCAQVDFRPAEKVAQIRADVEAPEDHIVESHILHEIIHMAIKPYTLIAERLAAQQTSPFREFVLGQLEDAEEQIVETLVRAHGFDRFAPYGEIAPDWPAFAPGSTD